MNANGGTPRPLFLSDSTVDALYPKFADRKIYFAKSEFFGSYSPIARPSQHEWDIYVAGIDGQDVQPLTKQRFYQITEPSLTSDGKKLLVSVESEAGSQMRIYSLDSDAAPVVLQPHVPKEPRSPIYADAAFASDGRSIVFLGASQGAKAFDYDVYRLDLGSNGVEKLTSANGYATHLRLSPDGKSAAFLRWSSTYGSLPTASRMYLLDLTTHSLKALPITGIR
jgi:TolB protein